MLKIKNLCPYLPAKHSRRTYPKPTKGRGALELYHSSSIIHSLTCYNRVLDHTFS